MAEPGALQFGEFQAVRELNQVGAATIYAARRASDVGVPAFAIKALQAPVFWSAEETASRLRLFVRRAVLQKRAAEAAAQAEETCWAPVHGEPQAADDRAFYVTDLYSQSAEDLCGGRRGTVDDRALWRIVHSVVAGLRVLDRVAARPHANLKPGNVLLSGRGSTLRAFLADPMPDDDAARAAGLAADLPGIGKLIYRLVLHEHPPLDSRLPAPPGAQWLALGRRGEGWRELCNRLLGAGVPFESLDQLAEAVRSLEPVKKRSPRRWLALAAMSVAVIAMGATIGYRIYLRKFAFEQEKWARFCREGNRLEHMMGENALKEMDNYTELKRLSARIRAEGGVESPREVAGVKDNRTFDVLGKNPPESVKHSLDAGRKTVRALELINFAIPVLENWDKLKIVDQYAQKCPDGELKTELQRVRKKFLDEPDAGSIRDVNNAAGLVDAAVQARQGAEGLRRIAPINASDSDPALVGFADRLTRLASGELGFSLETFKRHNDLANRALKLTVDNYDRLGIAAELKRPQLTGNQAVDEFGKWLDDAANYRLLKGPENPLNGDFGQRLAQVADHARDVHKTAEQSGLEGELKELAKVEERLKAISKDWTELNARPPVVAQKPSLTDKVKRLDDSLTKLRDTDLSQIWENVRQTPQQWKELAIHTFPDGSLPQSLLDLWRAEISRLENKVGDQFNLGAARGQAGILEQQVRNIQRTLVVSEPLKAHASDPLGAAVLKVAESQRIPRINRIVESARKDSNVAAALERELATQAGDWNSWLAGARSFIDQARGIDKRVHEDWYTLEPSWPKEGTLKSLYDDLKGSSLLTDRQIAEAVAPLLALLRQLADVKSNPSLLNAPDAALPVLVLAAWRAKDDLPLEQEVVVREWLMGRLGAVINREGTAKLASELSSVSAKRWLRNVRHPGAIGDVQKALVSKSKFSVSPSDLDEVAHYNLRLADLVATVTPQTLSEGASRDQAGEFVQYALALRAVTADAGVVGRVNELGQKLQEAKDKGVAAIADAGLAGPSKDEWKPREDDPPDRRTFERLQPPRATIEFARVSTGDRETWLSTAEISAEVFRAGLKRQDQNQFIGPIWNKTVENMTGPSVWTYKGNVINPQPSWIRTNRKDKLPDKGPPSLKHPMNFVTPQLAKAWAQSLGCRLPTSQEWRAATRAESDGARAHPRGNLRDKTWRDYLVAVNQALKNDPNSVELLPGGWRIAPVGGREVNYDAVWNAMCDRPAPPGAQDLYDDEHLFLLPAVPEGEDRTNGTYGKTFYHLIGNVAEWVVDEPDRPGGAAKTRVIGGSAFSAPVPPLSKPIDLPPALMPAYCDVGFRVAYPAGISMRNVLIAFAQNPPLLHAPADN